MFLRGKMSNAFSRSGVVSPGAMFLSELVTEANIFTDVHFDLIVLDLSISEMGTAKVAGS